MTVREITLDDLKRVLTEGAGSAESGLDGDVLDMEFEDLGYDSLALLETAARISREYGVVVDDDAATSAATPRAFLELVNRK